MQLDDTAVYGHMSTFVLSMVRVSERQAVCGCVGGGGDADAAVQSSENVHDIGCARHPPIRPLLTPCCICMESEKQWQCTLETNLFGRANPDVIAETVSFVLCPALYAISSNEPARESAGLSRKSLENFSATWIP